MGDIDAADIDICYAGGIARGMDRCINDPLIRQGLPAVHETGGSAGESKPEMPFSLAHKHLEIIVGILHQVLKRGEKNRKLA